MSVFVHAQGKKTVQAGRGGENGKSASYHSIKLPFDAEVAEKILNVIYNLQLLPVNLAMGALIHVAKTKLHPEQKKQMKTILLVILAMGRNCILEAPEPEPAEVIKIIPLQFHEFFYVVTTKHKFCARKLLP